KESISRIRAEAKHPFILGSFDRRNDDLIILGANKAIIASMGVQAQYRNLRLLYPKVIFQTLLHEFQFANNTLFGNMCSHIFERNVPRDNPDTEIFAHHKHQYIVRIGLALQIFGMSWEVEV